MDGCQVPPAQIQCPKCHILTSADSYFCGHCGYKIKEPPLALWGQVRIYLWSLLAPPAGLWWLYKYRNHFDPITRRAGYIAAALTIISLVLTVWATYVAISSVTTTINSQVNNFDFSGF